METLTLYELNNLMRGVVENTLDGEYWLQAELSEVRPAYNGHCYVEFVEKDKRGRDLVAKARGVIWAGTYGLLKPMFERETGRPLSPGLKVLVKVTVSFHELYGYSLTVRDIDPAYTLGDLARLRREILARLEADGILDDNKSLPLPMLANRIAVISSATAAGYGDFCNQLLRNEYGFRFTTRLFPAVMQGERVEQSVLSALDAIMAERGEWDVVVLIRGGGATSDLSGFDTYLLAAACAQFPLPVITGIGHERDDTVLDMVAHTRVKTPTAAAAFLVGHQLETASRLEEFSRRATEGAERRMERERGRMVQVAARLSSAFVRVKMADEHRLQRAMERLRMAWPVRMERERFRLQLAGQRCEAANPENLLKRGYSMSFCGGELVRDAARLHPGDTLTTRLAEGEIRSIVQ